MHRETGFTLIEVLIALAVTAFVAAVSYAGLAAVIDGVERSRAQAERHWEVTRALQVLSRDLRHFVPRPVRDEFGEPEPALMGGPAARFLLSFTRSGWHNPNAHPRSHLQRVNYVWEEDALWRESFPVLDRAGNTEAQRLLLLSGVTDLRLFFLDDPDNLGAASRGVAVDSRNWPESWAPDPMQPGDDLSPPLAVELALELEDLGTLRSLHALPPL